MEQRGTGLADCVCSGVQNASALARYGEVLRMVRARGMRVMLTLFHHSLPPWAIERGGWKDDASLPEEFALFAADVAAALGGDVEHWLTLNEPLVFSGHTYIQGDWPGGRGGPAGYSTRSLGIVNRALDRMAEAHVLAYAAIKAAMSGVARIGLALNVAAPIKKPHDFSAALAVSHVKTTMCVRPRAAASPRLAAPHAPPVSLSHPVPCAPPQVAAARCDRRPRRLPRPQLLGTNTVSLHGLEWRDGVEYSSSGRENDADHLYFWLRAYWLRYGIDLLVTENGIDDAEDILRPAYLLEHLAAVAAARADGVPVLGYVFWTVSDNLEWSDVCRIPSEPDSSTSRSFRL